MRRSLIFSFLLHFLTINVFFGQNITLNWDGFKVIDYGTEQIKVPKFTNDGFSYENGTVIYSVNKVSNQKLKAQNFVWEKITLAQLYDISESALTHRDHFDAALYYNKYDQTNLSGIAIQALKQENNTFYRLKSFTLAEENQLPSRTVSSKYGSTENPLKSGNFYKIKVDKSGVFKITTKFLRDNGINPSQINPQNFRIYGNGGVSLPELNTDSRYSALQENAIQVVGEEDGAWNENDYALFYAQGPNAFNIYSNSFGNGYKRTETRTDNPFLFYNQYDDFSYYFINFDLGPGKRVAESNINAPGALINRYDAYQYLKEDKYNLQKFGRTWTGDGFNNLKSVTFNTTSPITNTDNISFATTVVAYASQNNAIDLNINGKSSVSRPVGNDEIFKEIIYKGSVSELQGNQLTFNYSPNISANPGGKFYLKYAEVMYKEDLNFNGSQMNFRDFSIDERSGSTFGFAVGNASTVEQIWDVSDITNAKKITNKASGNSQFIFGYTANSLYFNNEFVAFRQESAFNPVFVSRIENQDLSALSGIDYLMITSTEMMGQAQRLASYYQGTYNVAVVDQAKIYNEFSSGSKDITAIRDFVTKLNTPNGTLKYVFILGDASYDYKGKEVPNSDIVPSYQSENSVSLSSSFVTDDYFVMTQPQTATQITRILPDLPIGRLPAGNLTEAKLLIDKTLAYYNGLTGQSTPFGEWRLKMDFVVDDDADIQFPFHNTINQALVNNFEQGVRSEYNIRKLYLDSFPAEISAGGQRYPEVNQAISNDVGNSLFLFYFGHGGIGGWAQERVLSVDEIQNFNNYNTIYSRFPLVSTITCEFTLWDDPQTFSAGEQVIKHRNGGASTMITSSRKIGVGYGEELSSIFLQNLFALQDDEFLTMGDAFLKTRIQKGAHSDHLRVNFLGDPAGKLSRPKRNLVIDQIESPVPGQIRALDFIKVKGHINLPDGTLDSSFNGRAVVNIYDKKITKKTRNNDQNPKMNPPLVYKEEGSPIVKSSGTVTNGNFVAEFYVPKDINYENGDGRLLVYANNSSKDVFSNQIQKVGGINPDGINDSEAPKINLYMNNINFADGGITDQNPTFLACVSDDKGINSTGSGVGHDVTVVLDGEIINTKVLNDFYFSGEGLGCVNPNLADYQKGYVTYPFRSLTPGQHQLSFKIWDINNNSTSGTLNFIVKDESEQNLIINRPLNWPNPFTNKTYVQFEHNCDDILDVNVQIFTISGRLVRTISTMVTAEPFLQGFRTPRTAIEWDGKDDYGDTVGKGTYIFKIFARSQNQEKCKGSATAVEKMVMLK